jgi:hypothetical protein
MTAEKGYLLSYCLRRWRGKSLAMTAEKGYLLS